MGSIQCSLSRYQRHAYDEIVKLTSPSPFTAVIFIIACLLGVPSWLTTAYNGLRTS